MKFAKFFFCLAVFVTFVDGEIRVFDGAAYGYREMNNIGLFDIYKSSADFGRPIATFPAHGVRQISVDSFQYTDPSHAMFRKKYLRIRAEEAAKGDLPYVVIPAPPISEGDCRRLDVNCVQEKYRGPN